MRLPKIEIPKIPSEEKSPIVSQLLGIIEQQSVLLQRLVEENQLLRDEIARLKNQINFMEILRAGQMDYVINEEAMEYMDQQRLPKSLLSMLEEQVLRSHKLLIQ